MLRRLFWIGVGVWAARRLQTAAQRVSPAGVVDQVVGAGRHLWSDLGAALREGRRTTKEVERVLHAQAGHQVLRGPAIEVLATASEPPREIVGRR